MYRINDRNRVIRKMEPEQAESGSHKIMTSEINVIKVSNVRKLFAGANANCSK